MRLLILSLIILSSQSCSKKDVGLNTGWNMLSHVENNDTISYVYFPNTFTPNGDGSNDIFKIIGQGMEYNNLDFKIFKKSGENIFVTTNYNIGWDGTYKGIKAASGIYYFKLTAEDTSQYVYHSEGSLYLLQ